MSNLPNVEAIYHAVFTGDAPAFLALLDEGVRWESWDHGNSAQAAGVPTMQPRDGRDAVVGFLMAMGQLGDPKMEVRGMMEGGDQVAVQFLVECTTPNGTRLVDEEIHLWTFNEAGKVMRLRHYIDTAKHIAAWS